MHLGELNSERIDIETLIADEVLKSFEYVIINDGVGHASEIIVNIDTRTAKPFKEHRFLILSLYACSFTLITCLYIELVNS